MTGGKDDYYRPWLDATDDDPAAAPPPPAPQADQRPSAAPPPATEPVAPARRAGDRAQQAFAGVKRGWAAFAAATIRWGERADVPRRVAQLELGDKAARARAALARTARQAGDATARGARAAGRRGTIIAGQVGSSAGAAAKSVGSATRTRVRQGIDDSLAATRAGGAKLADGARQAARPVIARVAPPKPAAPVFGSALDGLVAREDDAAAGVPASGSAGDLPLFGALSVDRGPAAADASPSTDASPAESPRADGPAEPAVRARRKPPAATRAAASPEMQDSEPMAAGADIAEPRRGNRVVFAAIALGALVVAVLAGSAFWGRDASPSAAGPADAPRDAAAAADIDPAQRADIEAVVEAYILDHPDIIPRALERLQQRESAAAIARLRPAIERPFAGAWAGNANGDVVVTEYSDFACTFCRRSVADVERLIKADDRVKIVYRELPILSAQSSPAAKVGLAAARKGRYRDYHLALFALGQPSEANILAAAAKAGMTPQDVAAAKADPALDREIASNVSVAQQLRFEGTPSFVVGDRILHGAVGYEALKAAVAEAREAGTTS